MSSLIDIHHIVDAGMESGLYTWQSLKWSLPTLPREDTSLYVNTGISMGKIFLTNSILLAKLKQNNIKIHDQPLPAGVLHEEGVQ